MKLFFLTSIFLLLLSFSLILVAIPQKETLVLSVPTSTTSLNENTHATSTRPITTPALKHSTSSEVPPTKSSPTKTVAVKTTPSPTPAPLPPPPKPIDQSIIYALGTQSVVNFLCDQGDNHYTLATGVIITRSGYILSNAHITDNLPLKPTCTIRRGSPAKDFGTAHLVFIPRAYRTVTTDEERGAHDISIWKLDTVPESLSFFSIDFDSKIIVGSEFLTLSYPAELLSNQIIFNNLNVLFSNTIVDAVDSSIIQSRASLSAQHGSSGGILVDPYTTQIRGIIFGINQNNDIASRALYSVTPTAINATVFEEKQKTLMDFLAENP